MDIDKVLNEVQLSLNFFRSDFNSEFKVENESCGLTLSAGVSTTEKIDKSFEKLYKAADTALYSAKKNGKNKVNYH
jgi:diguanylate cyclase (GGDEF)-like protein